MSRPNIRVVDAPDLSPCCGAHVSVDEHGTVYCKACYEAIEPTNEGATTMSEIKTDVTTTEPAKDSIIAAIEAATPPKPKPATKEKKTVTATAEKPAKKSTSRKPAAKKPAAKPAAKKRAGYSDEITAAVRLAKQARGTTHGAPGAKQHVALRAAVSQAVTDSKTEPTKDALLKWLGISEKDLRAAASGAMPTEKLRGTGAFKKVQALDALQDPKIRPWVGGRNGASILVAWVDQIKAR